jgi:hypothetical protein
MEISNLFYSDPVIFMMENSRLVGAREVGSIPEEQFLGEGRIPFYMGFILGRVEIKLNGPISQ